MTSSKALLASVHAIPPALFPSLEPALNQQLPLTDLHWTSAARRHERVIPQLQLSLTPWASSGATAGRASTDQVLPSPSTSSPAALLEKPLVHLCFVSCDDSEVYRQSVRHQVRSWVDQVQAYSNSPVSPSKAEWLIVLVTPASHLSKGKFYQRKSTVLDKLKSDFNASSSSSKGKDRDRCVALPVHPTTTDGATASASSITTQNISADPSVWAAMMARLKDVLIAAFDANVLSTEEELRKLDAQRTVPGWNYCVFFERKEGLAFAFESIGLKEDAVMVYDELEAGFEQSLKGVCSSPLIRSILLAHAKLRAQHRLQCPRRSITGRRRPLPLLHRPETLQTPHSNQQHIHLRL